MTIALRRDPATGKQNVIVKLDSDPDALPVEHEQMHRALVEKLIGAGLNPEDLGDVHVEREGAPAAGSGPAVAEPERQAERQGG